MEPHHHSCGGEQWQRRVRNYHHHLLEDCHCCRDCWKSIESGYSAAIVTRGMATDVCIVVAMQKVLGVQSGSAVVQAAACCCVLLCENFCGGTNLKEYGWDKMRCWKQFVDEVDR